MAKALSRKVSECLAAGGSKQLSTYLLSRSPRPCPNHKPTNQHLLLLSGGGGQSCSSIWRRSAQISSKTQISPNLIFTPSPHKMRVYNLIFTRSRSNFSFKSPIPPTPPHGIGIGKLASKPFSAVRSVASRYKEAFGLQVEAFWKRNYMALVGVLGVGACMLLWRLMFGIANTFVGLSEGMAKYGFLALSSAIVTFAGLYIRSRFTINPDKVYRIAMRKLNTSAGILEIMGAPLSGTDVRAYVMSGGGVTLKNFRPKLGSKRCFLIFPIRGSERKGLVNVEVKKKKGQYDMKLLAVDVPMTTGPDQRFFLVGDELEYKVGGELISVLRDPVVKAMAAVKEFEALDQKEDEEDTQRELEEAERKHQEEIQQTKKASP